MSTIVGMDAGSWAVESNHRTANARARAEAASARDLWRLWVPCLVLVSCAAPVESRSMVADEPALPAPGPQFEVRIDEMLPPEYQAAAVAAVDAWSAHGFDLFAVIVPSTMANVRVGACSTEAFGCATPGGSVHFVPEAFHASARVTPEFVALHEFGHWLGLGAHLAPGNVMQAGEAEATPPLELTERDVAAVRAAVGL